MNNAWRLPAGDHLSMMPTHRRRAGQPDQPDALERTGPILDPLPAHEDHIRRSRRPRSVGGNHRGDGGGGRTARRVAPRWKRAADQMGWPARRRAYGPIVLVVPGRRPASHPAASRDARRSLRGSRRAGRLVAGGPRGRWAPVPAPRHALVAAAFRGSVAATPPFGRGQAGSHASLG